MSNRTLRTINIVTVLFIVAVLALSICLITINTKSPTIGDASNDSNAVGGELNGGILQTTSGTMKDVDPTMPEDAIAIRTQAQLKNFIENTEVAKAMYGYLLNDIILDDWYQDGSKVIMSANKTLDGRGFAIAIATAPSSIPEATEDQSTYSSIASNANKAGGLFIAENNGIIKNVNFTYDLKTYLICMIFAKTYYGIVTGINAGTIDNVSLTMAEDSVFRIAKHEGSEPSTNTDAHTVIIGGIVGMSTGVVNNVHAELNGTIFAHARYYGRNFKLFVHSEIKGTAKAYAGGLVGLMSGNSPKVTNVVVTGGSKAIIESKTNGIEKNGDLNRHIGVVVAINSNWAGSSTNNGIIDKVIDGFAGSLPAGGSTSGGTSTGGGTFDCSQNATNILRVARLNINTLYHCGCDHNKQTTYHKLESVGDLQVKYAFSQDESKFIDYEATFSDENLVKGGVIFDYKANKRSFTNSTVKNEETQLNSYKDGLTTVKGSLEKYSELKNYDSAKFSSGYVLDMALANEDGEIFAYNGGVHNPVYNLTYKNGEAYTFNASKANIKHSNAEGELSTAPMFEGTYSVQTIIDADNALAYYDTETRTIALADPSLKWNYSINIGDGSITTPEDKWYNDFTYTYTLPNAVAGAIDKLQYSNDGGVTWVDAVGTSYKLITADSSANPIEYIWRGVKGSTIVTKETEANTIKFDNVKPTFTDLVYDGDIAVWTVSSIMASFKSTEEHSGYNSLTVTTTKGDVALEGTNPEYSFTMNDSVKYTLTIKDNADNIVVHEVTPKIDQITPSITVSSNGYAAGEEIYDAVVFDIISVFGSSGAKVEYALTTDGSNYGEWVVLNLDADKKGRLRFADYLNEKIKFKLTNNIGIADEYEFGTVFINKYVITFAFNNMDITETSLTKQYDNTTKFKGIVEIVNVRYSSNGESDLELPMGEYSNLVVTGTYSSNQVGENYTITLNIEPIEGMEHKFVLTDTEYTTSGGVIIPKDIELTINEHHKQFTTDNPRTVGYTLSGVENNEHAEIKVEFRIDALKTDNVGKYDIVMTGFVATNYNVIYAKNEDGSDSGIGAMIIDPRLVSVEFGGYMGLRYNGTRANVTAFYYDIDNNKISIEVVYDREPINAGEYVATAAFADSNYANIVGTDDLNFSILARTTSITVKDKTVVYDGNPHSLEYSLDYDANDVEVTYNGSTTEPTNYGTYKVIVKVAAYENYAETVEYATLTIKKATFNGITLTSKSVPYSAGGSSLEIVGNLPNGTTLKYNIGKSYDVGKHVYKATLTNSNYNDLTLTATLTIENKIFGEIEFEDKTFVYDGTAKSIALKNAPSTATVIYTINGVPADGFLAIDAGTYYVKAEVSQTGYQTVVYNATLEISPAVITGFAFEEEEVSFEFDGKEHSIEVTGDLDGYTVAYQRNKAINAGKYFVTATIYKKNHQPLVLTTYWYIGSVFVDIAYEGVTNVKVGEITTLKATFTDINGETQTLNVDLSSVNFAKAGEYSVKPIFNNNNYAATMFTSDVVLTVDDGGSKGANTAVIVGASVGGSLGGLAIIGGLVAFFVLRKKKLVL